MKKFFLVALLVMQITNAKYDEHYILKNPLFLAADGSLINAEDMQACMRTADKCSGLMHGCKSDKAKPYDAQDSVLSRKETCLVHYFDGKPVSLADLAKMEQAAKGAMGEEQKRKLHATLHGMKKDFEIFTDEMLKKASLPEAYELNRKLIAEFIEVNGRPDSILCHWGSGREKEHLAKTSATAFFIFLKDLSEFLKTVVRSATKARAQYAEIVHQGFLDGVWTHDQYEHHKRHWNL